MLSMERNNNNDRREDASRLHSDVNATLPVIKSENLFENAREVGIEHEGAIYRLKITKQGKLILNK